MTAMAMAAVTVQRVLMTTQPNGPPTASPLSGGVDENDNSQLDQLLRWLLSLRHRGIAVVLIHHAGKSGKQRGASRREDLLDTSIVLERPDDEETTPHQGAHFIVRFVKNRHPKPVPDVLERRLTEHHGALYWQYNEPMKIDRATEILRAIWEMKPETQKEQHALDDAGTTGGATPVTVGERPIVPGATAFDAGEPGNRLPSSLVVTLVLLAVAAAAAAAPAARRRVLDRRTA